MQNKEKATKSLGELLNIGVNTKILPEVCSWHFEGTWNHMAELNGSHGETLADASQRSTKILECAVSSPVGIRLSAHVPKKIRSALITALAL